MLLLVKIG